VEGTRTLFPGLLLTAVFACLLRCIMGNIGYMGQVTSVRDGYGFVGIGTVTKADGTPHGLMTLRDIFVHQDDCRDFTLHVGVEVEFEAVEDPKRGSGYYRAQNVTEALQVEVEELLPTDGSAPVPGLEIQTTENGTTTLATPYDRLPVHVGMKPIADEAIAKAKANRPLEGVPRTEEGAATMRNDTDILKALSTALFSQFPGLHNIDLTFEIVGYDPAEQDALVAETVTNCHELGMEDQATLTQEEYGRFKATRDMFAWIFTQGWLQPGTQATPSVLNGLMSLVKSVEGASDKALTVEGLKKLFGFMGAHQLLRPSSVLPVKYLPDLFMAAPVWFFALDGIDERSATQNLVPTGASNNSSRDPLPTRATSFVCELLPNNRRWNDAFQMFNRRTRPIATYKGDVVPPAVLRLIREAKEVFDYVVIMTPYLDIAGADWKDLAWLRSIDPYVVGFKKNCPTFFILARFSNSGVFPLLPDLVADTMQFLKEKKEDLRRGFNAVSQPYWWNRHQSALPCAGGDYLASRVDEMLQAYEADHLFDWLRNEWTPAEDATITTVKPST